jgi:hypothetical protein
MQKKKSCDINPYTLAGIPVILNNKLTLEKLINLVYNDKVLNKICFYSKDFYEECKKTPDNEFFGKICFYWQTIYENDETTIKNSSPKMEVDMVDNNNLRYGIELVKLNNIKNCTLFIDNTIKINDKKDNLKNIIEVNPTLFEVVYGLYWELSFLGKPEDRDEKVQEIYDSVEELKNE